MTTTPGVKRLGSYPLWFNQHGTVVIFCSVHEKWIAAANAGRHFSPTHPVAERIFV